MNTEAARVFAWGPWLASYAPKDVPCWPAIAPFVRDSATAYFNHCSPGSKNHALSSVRAVVAVAAFQHGKVTLTRRSVFTRVTVQQLDQESDAAARRDAAASPKADRAAILAKRETSIGTRHSHLVRIGRILNPGGGWGPEPATHSRFVTPPYSQDEIGWLEDCVARNQGLARVNGEALLVLGLGAGLAGRELLVRARDCHVSAKGIEIQVGDRLVPVLARYEARLRALLADAEPDHLLIGSQAQHKNAVSEAVARVHIAEDGPALQPGRLRNTWLLEHLAARVDIKTLMAAAGLRSLTPISDLAAYLPEHTRPDALAMLRRGGERP